MGWIEDRISSGKTLTARSLYDKFGFQNVVGVHIYARRAIAGPMCVTAVVLKPSHKLDVRPARKLSLSDCYALNDAIRIKALMLEIGWVDPYTMRQLKDEAIMVGMRAALRAVTPDNPPSIILVDNYTMSVVPNSVRDTQTPVFAIKEGISRVDSIMAASIVNRIAHHDLMKFLDEEYPEYDWLNNGGFATAQHIQLIKQYGITPHHRDLSKVKMLSDFKAFANKRWRKEHEDSYFGT